MCIGGPKSAGSAASTALNSPLVPDPSALSDITKLPRSMTLPSRGCRTYADDRSTIEISFGIDVRVAPGYVDVCHEVRVLCEELREAAIALERRGERPNGPIKDNGVAGDAAKTGHDDLPGRGQDRAQLIR